MYEKMSPMGQRGFNDNGEYVTIIFYGQWTCSIESLYCLFVTNCTDQFLKKTDIGINLNTVVSITLGSSAEFVRLA